MLLGQVEAFLETVRLGSVTAAAASLFVTQPALTGRLNALEAEVGAQLLLRTRQGARLTEAGKAFLPYAQRAVRSIEEGRRALEDLDAGIAGELALGAAPAVSTYLLPGVLRRFAILHPNVRLTVRTGHSEEILDLVLRDEVRLGLVRELRHPDIETTPLYEDEVVLVTDPRHRLAARGRVPVGELGLERLVLFDRTSSYHVLTSALFREAGVEPRGVIELDNIEAAKKMVEEGLGVALLPRIAIAAELASGALREVAIADAPAIRRLTVAIRRRDAGMPTGPAAAFLALVEAIRAVWPGPESASIDPHA